MNPWLVAGLVLGFAVIGWHTGRILATGGYRIPEDEADHPTMNPWWTGPALGALVALTTWRLGDLAHGAALPAYLLFCWLTVALIWTDLDVHRLPVGLVRPGTAGIVALLGLAEWAVGWRHWRAALLGAALVGALFLLLHFLPGGGIGWGDVRLAPLIGLLLGWLGPAHLLVGVLATFLLGGVAAVVLLLARRVGLRSRIAYGPAMCLGVFVALGWTSQILKVLLGR